MRPRTSHDAPDSLPRPPHWGDDAKCRKEGDPDFWFAEGEDAEAVADRAAAKRICSSCLARPSCLHDALERGEPLGVWGGLDAEERTQLRLIPQVRPEKVRDGGSRPQAQDAAQSA